MGIVVLLIGIGALVVGILGMRRWYPENAAGKVTGATNAMMMGGFFFATIFIILGIAMLSGALT